MDKKGTWIELIIKSIFLILSIILTVYVTKDGLSMITLLKANDFNEDELYNLLYTTHIGDIFDDMGIVEIIDIKTINKAIFSFFANIEWVDIIFLFFAIPMGFLYFIFLKWKLVRNYFTISILKIILYACKHIFFGLSIVIFYRDNLGTLATGIIVGTSLYIFFCLLEILCLCLFMFKFIFNITSDIKTLMTS